MRQNQRSKEAKALGIEAVSSSWWVTECTLSTFRQKKLRGSEEDVEAPRPCVFPTLTPRQNHRCLWVSGRQGWANKVNTLSETDTIPCGIWALSEDCQELTQKFQIFDLRSLDLMRVPLLAV